LQQNQRPRCAATLPNVTKLLTEARSHRVSVIYGVIPTGSVEPRAGAAKAAGRSRALFIKEAIARRRAAL
jgi:hypothetical protein